MINNNTVRTTFTCKICGRTWNTKVYADFCYEQCKKGTPVEGTGIVN